jgi:tRNA-specific 2-thiouridylase
VLCNREIKFGVMREYASRLGADWLATGHYARLRGIAGSAELLKGLDRDKDQSYFLHAVSGNEFQRVLFPLGELTKRAVRGHARAVALPVAEKKDSTGICFIGERPFREFLRRYLPVQPGPIREPGGRVIGEHEGLAFYTVGQRQGLGLGGLSGFGPEPWYVAAKNLRSNCLLVVQGVDHPWLYHCGLRADSVHWINAAPRGWADGAAIECRAKTRYRQPDQTCTVSRNPTGTLEVQFAEPQRAITPGQSVVFYLGQRCLGGATIREALPQPSLLEAVG